MPISEAGLYYEEHGPPDAPPLILSSGLGGSASYWAPNIPAFAECFRVITYDHRGTGRSSRDLPDASVASMSADVLALMDALQIEEAKFVGHALGGMVGIETAIMTTRIERLVVVNGWRKLDPHTSRCFDMRLALLRDSGPTAYLHAQPLFLYPPDWISSHDGELAEEAKVQLAHFPAIETVERRIAAVRAYDPELINLTAPPAWLVIGSRDDMLVPLASALDVATPMDRVDHFIFDWGGHACNVTDPARFNRVVLDFLRS
jgi:aminoacrylate hydrolase